MTTPELSVVVPSVNGWADLQPCLDALRAEAGSCRLETLVVDRVGRPVRDQLEATFPDVTVIAVEPRTTIPAMRALAIHRASAPCVAIIEDHVLVPHGWARAMVAAQQRHGGVVGGAVVAAPVGTIADTAAFLCDYSEVMPPLTAGPARRLTGNNTIYPRDVLEANRAIIDAGRWEDDWHRELHSLGVPLTCCPEIVVVHQQHRSIGAYLSQRYYYARAFAADRVSGRSAAIRLVYGCGALLLPPLLLGRIVRRVWHTRRNDLLPTLPAMSLLVSAWGAGEAIGCWFGGGDALARVC